MTGTGDSAIIPAAIGPRCDRNQKETIALLFDADQELPT
jgi:hypothetical protein